MKELGVYCKGGWALACEKCGKHVYRTKRHYMPTFWPVPIDAEYEWNNIKKTGYTTGNCGSCGHKLYRCALPTDRNGDIIYTGMTVTNGGLILEVVKFFDHSGDKTGLIVSGGCYELSEHWTICDYQGGKLDPGSYYGETLN